MLFASWLSAGLLLAAVPAMAQDQTSNPLNAFISAAQSIATQFGTLESQAPTSATATSLPASSTAPATPATSGFATSSTPTATSSSAPVAAATSSGMSKGTRDTIIIICSVIGALLLALLALGIWLCLRRKKKRRAVVTEDAKDAGSPLRKDEWYHGNDSHHGYMDAHSAAVSRNEVVEHPSNDKGLGHGVSRVDDASDVPDISDHPAFSRDSDPYTAAGVGAAGVAGASRAPHGSGTEPARRSMGERRTSGQMPTRKPVGSPPSISSRHRDSNPLSVDTSAAVIGAGLGAAAGARSSTSASSPHAEHNYKPRTPRRSNASGTARLSNSFVSPTQHSELAATTSAAQHPEPTATSPLSSHPSNPLLYGGPQNKRNSRLSQRSRGESLHETPAVSASKIKRPQTPLGFDFGLPKASDSPAAHTSTDPEAQPLTSDFEPQALSTHHPESQPLSTGYPESQPLASDFESQALYARYPESQPLTSSIEPQFITAYHPSKQPQPEIPHTPSTNETATLPVSRFSNTHQHSGITGPTPAQRASLERRSFHYLDYQSEDQPEPKPPVPEIPERSPRRFSHASFEEPFAVRPGSIYGSSSLLGSGSGFSAPGEVPIPPRSLKRASWNQSHENVAAVPHSQSPRDAFMHDTTDLAYPPPRSGYDSSPRHSPRIGPALGHRSRSRARTGSASDLAGPHGSPYAGAGGRSQAFGGRAPGHGHSVYGPGESGAASSVESWVSARAMPAVPTPWEDNPIRRNSSSGHLRRPELRDGERKEVSSGSSSGGQMTGQDVVGRLEKSVKQQEGEKGVRGERQGDSGYYSGYSGQSGYDASWGQGNVEEPVFEKYGAQHSRRRRRSRSGSSGFDPRYGRWTDSTFDEEFRHGLGVGEAL